MGEWILNVFRIVRNKLKFDKKKVLHTHYRNKTRQNFLRLSFRKPLKIHTHTLGPLEPNNIPLLSL